MIGVAPETAALADWGFALLGAGVIIACAAVAVHNHFLHKRLMKAIRGR